MAIHPDPGAARDQTIAAEQAIEDLHAEALAQWAPIVAAVVLPTLAGAALAPDLAALTTATAIAEWTAIAEAVIVTRVSLLWAAAVLEALDALGIPHPPVTTAVQTGPGEWTTHLAEYDAAVLRAIDHATPDMDVEQLRYADAVVESSPPLRAARNTVLAEQRAKAEQIPLIVQDKAARAVAAVPPAESLDAVADAERRAVADTLTPGSAALRDVARNQGYDAAAVLNHAVVTAAAQQNEEFGEDLLKGWIATLDGKTRPTHWAADGQRVPLAGKFKVGAAELEFPGDPTGPPEEIKNCRCRVGISAADEPLPDEVDRHTERLDGRDSVVVNRDGRTQAEEIERRRRAGNVRARDTSDGVGRVASVDVEEFDMTDLVEADVIDEPEPDFAADLTALVAASASTAAEPRLRTYDPKLFSDPKLTRPTAPTMNNETGRIFGHLAEWGHVIRGGRDVTPRNRNGYRNFHTGQVQTTDGRQLSVGRLTVLGGHASTEPGVTVAAVRAHYDDVSTAFGLVRVGEDRFGIWFSGVPYPGVDPETFQQGMVTQLSGDWRDCDGYPLDMVAAHAVNTQGFPIYSALTGPEGRDLALVASLGPVRRTAAAAPVLVPLDDVRVVVAEALAEDRRKAALAARLDSALTASHSAVGDPPTPTERITALIEALPKA